jgi:hypothetical protein
MRTKIVKTASIAAAHVTDCHHVLLASSISGNLNGVSNLQLITNIVVKHNMHPTMPKTFLMKFI